ncbi:MAG: molybdopterin molybdotransferase [Cyclobacteriaceae bacterium]
MITVAEAQVIVMETVSDFGVEQVPLSDASGRILRETIVADRPMPPYDRVTMDGIAISFQSLGVENSNFEIEGIAPAGALQMALSDQQKCIEVMTGAVLPTGTDTVIPYEWLDIQGREVKLLKKEIRFGQNVHQVGSDGKPGVELLSPHTLIDAPEVGVCATVGKSRLLVSKVPRVMIVSTGDELVDVEQQPLPHQIRKSNVHQLSAMLRSFGIQAELQHLDDNKEAIQSGLEEALQRMDVILLSGGVSMGKFDFIPDMLTSNGVTCHFHKVAQRPGKPFWFGTHPQGATIFAFPGNPVSSFMCAHVYLLPWLRACLQGKITNSLFAKLGEDVTFKPSLNYFLQVKLTIDHHGILLAMPMFGNGSGDLSNLALADAFIHLPAEEDLFRSGDAYPIIPFRPLFF